LPKATHEGDLTLGNTVIHCAVLEDGRRLLTQSDFMRALGRSRQAKGRAYYVGDVNLPAFLTAKNLKPFIDNDLYVTSSQVEFRPLKGGLAYGYPAELLPKVCDVFLKARDAGDKVLKPSQLHIAKQADILIRALAHIGIIALVDEATGHQYDRARDALARILEKFIAEELQPWTRSFPLEFYKHIFRLRNWPFDPGTMKSPRVLGKYTNNIVYARLAPGVLDELRKKSPAVDGRRKHKFYRWLTGDIGHPRLLAHLEGVKIIMRESQTWDEFLAKLDKHYPIIETTELGFDIELMSQ
jgi:P63C domain